MAGIAARMMGVGIPAAQAVSINGLVAGGLTATGTTQTDALQLSLGTNVFSTVAASTGAKLASNPTPGDTQTVYNGGASTLTLYPQTGAKINNGSTNAGISIGANTRCDFTCVSATQWIANLSA